MKRKGISGGGWDNPKGVGNRFRIQLIISESSASGYGITIAKISKKTGLSRRTVTTWVNELFEERRITKIGKTYFVPDDMVDDYWIMPAYYLNYLLVKNSVAKFRVDPIQSNWLNSDSDDLEGALFKIANRIGAFITFVLIEAMRPSRKLMSRTMRKNMYLKFIKSSISIDDLFETFVYMVPGAQGIHISKATHDRLSGAFRHVYPSIYKAMIDGIDEYSHLLDLHSSSED